MLLVAASAWMLTLVSRLYAGLRRADAWQADFYRSHLAAIIFLLIAVALATLWMLFFCVGVGLLDYAIVPAFMLLCSALMQFPFLKQARMLLRSIVFAMFCAIPAFYFSFTLTPWRILNTSAVWYLGLLFYVVAVERERLKQGQADSRESFFSAFVLLAILAFTLLSGAKAPSFERTLCITIAIGAGCLQGYTRLRRTLRTDTAMAFSWAPLAVAALLGIILYAPHSW